MRRNEEKELLGREIIYPKAGKKRVDVWNEKISFK